MISHELHTTRCRGFLLSNYGSGGGLAVMIISLVGALMRRIIGKSFFISKSFYAFSARESFWINFFDNNEIAFAYRSQKLTTSLAGIIQFDAMLLSICGRINLVWALAAAFNHKLLSKRERTFP